MAPTQSADSRLCSFTREQSNWKSVHQLGKFYATAADSIAGQMIRPYAARQFYFRVAPVTGKLRHQSRHDRRNRFAADECDDVIATRSANFERLDSCLRAEPFRMPLAQRESIAD
jgi:hypothetical protein